VKQQQQKMWESGACIRFTTLIGAEGYSERLHTPEIVAVENAVDPAPPKPQERKTCFIPCWKDRGFHRSVSMMKEEQEDTTLYKVVVNHEEQYSIWPVDRENALGWKREP